MLIEGGHVLTDKALLLLAALAPTAMSLIGIIFAKADLKDFKSDLRDFKSEVRVQFSDMQRVQQSHEKKLDEVMAAGHKDALEIMRQMTVLHERVAVVEAKQGR